ncbi:hypothetical protein M501DRAFT_1015751 [Patellaria atrata CBS 101060]|uniref:Uncharacterized protein n=1 Tax=Patellaria atrata CBS 101060 TaxID=1346257 RepID=A0A9P4SBQ5_9PEZI|nr:hypothetical protein M501DRAFT_1015751 [Patellaria atrata CBS 101060]
MPSWRPLPRIAFAICVYPFQPSSASDLPLEIGDELYIIEQGGKDGSWYRGYLVAPPSLLSGLTCSKGQTLEARVFSGIFPRCCVEVRELLGETKVGCGIEEQGEQTNGTRAAQSDAPINGPITPTESTSTRSITGKPANIVSDRSSRQKLERQEGKRIASHGSLPTVRSDRSQPLLLPLSPVSVLSRDPDAPKPAAPVPMLKIGDETPTSSQEPLVDEIASCLREWHATKLHELLLTRKYSKLDKMSALVQRLDTARRQLLHKVLTAQELRILRESTVWDLVSGNKLLCGEIIVRSPSQRGRILTADDSAIEVTTLQSLMSLLDERPASPVIDEHTIHHLLIQLKNFAGEYSTGSTTIAFYLCTKTPGSPPRPLSEVHSMDLSARDSSGLISSDLAFRALFVDLSSTDIGEGSGENSQLYVVFKLLTSEPFKGAGINASTSKQPRESTSSQKGPIINTSIMGSTKNGRRSYMWGSKTKREAETPSRPSEGRSTSDEASKARATDNRPPSAARSNASNGQKTVKRTVGVGAIRVDRLLRANMEAEQDVVIHTPSLSPEDEDTDETVDDIISELLPSMTRKYKKHSLVRRISIFAKSFISTDAEALIRQTPTLLHGISQARKIGFSGAPTKPRSDIYLTLTSPFLPRNAVLSHPKSGTTPLASQSGMANLQLTLEVRRATGERIENCIYPSCNSTGHTAWRTTAVERGEPWNLTIRLAISPDDVPGSHIVMSVADAPGFPFALCWMPLWSQEAFVRDGDHSLALYKYDEYTSSMISGRGAYLSLPWSSKRKDESVLGPMAAVHLRTYLCSTKYSQDPDLLGLLKWSQLAPGELSDLLKRFTFVPEIEIVKLVNEVFDALFEILVQYAGNDEKEDLVFNALVIVLGIVHDRRFNLGPLVDQYAEERFNYPYATSCLIRSFTRLLANPVDPETSRKLRATSKVGAHIFKFIVNARHQEKEKEAGIGITSRQPTFTKDLCSIFKSLDALMTNPAPILIGTKTIVVQHFHTWLPELSSLMNSKDILQLASQFIQSCSEVQGKLVLYKLVLIINFTNVEAFKAPDTRRELLVNTVKWLAPHWGRTPEVTVQWKEQVRLCCSVVASQLNELGQEACEYIPKLVDSYRAIQLQERTSKKTLSLLFPVSYPFPTRPTTTEATFDEALIEISAVLAATTNLPTTIHLDIPQPELAEFLYSTLQVYLSILGGEAFPSDWLSVQIYHHKSTIRTLDKLSSILIDSFIPHPDEADQFSTELWKAFFDALLKLVGSDALALETFPEQKRRAVWKIAGDVRELGADLLRRSWEAIGWETSAQERKQYGLEKMGGFQVQYVPSLVAPIVELCLSVHEGLRSVAIEVLQTMIVSEWTLNQSLDIIQAEMIECLDELFKSKTLTESILQKLFINELIDLFEPLAQNADDQLLPTVKSLVSTIDELLDLLVAVHSAETTGEAFQIMDTLHLMDFLKDMQKEDIYIRYVHQLAELQASSGNFTEAGLALRLHSDLYDWDPTATVPALTDPVFPAQTSFERKEQLYFQMIKYFEEGQSWDNALETYQELAGEYEQGVFDFAKLARTQRAMATIYESINRGDKQNNRYFRVVYRGLGFPLGLRDKQFIFEAAPTDRLATFTDRLQQQHPSAQILSAGASDDLEGQFLQIYPVSPQRDLLHPIYQRAKVAQPVREYHLLSRPAHFSTATRRQASDAGGKDHIVEKTIYTTAEPFPTILKRSEIVSVGVVTLTPLQAALERTTRKTSELLALEKRVVDGDDSGLTSLTEALMISVDPASESSVSRHRVLLPTEPDSTSEEKEREEPPVTEPLENALRVALIDHALAVKRCLGLHSRPAHQATKADLTQRFEMTFAPELTFLNPPSLVNNHRSTSPSWLIPTSPPANFTPTPTQLHHPRKSPTPPTTASDARATRHEKNRLSLSFMKRASIVEGRDGRNGRPSHDTSAETESPRDASRSRSKDHGRRLSFLYSTPGTISNQQSQSAERPDTGKTEPTTVGSSSIGERVGSVRKRLSALKIRNKPSEASVRSKGFEDQLVEE